LIEEYKQQTFSLKKKENRKVHPAQQSQEFRSLESTLESVNKDIQKLSKEKEQIIQANNGNSKQSLNNEVKTLIDLKNNTENKIAEERAFYSQEVKNLHQARNDAVASAGFSRKKSLDVFYQDRISSLEKGFKAKIDLLEEDLNGYMVKIEKKRSNEESLNKLSPATTDSLKKIEKQMDEAKRKKQEIFDQLDSMSKQKDLEMDILDNEIQNKQILINSLSEKQIRLDEKIAKTKNNNFLYILAASFYGKPPLEISPTEQMSFSFYFVGLGAVFLALLPSLLAILSVMLEKSIEKPVTNKISYKQLIHDSFIAINFTLKEILQKLASKKEDKHKMKIAYESKIKLEKDKVQKELEEHKDEFRKILLSKDNMIAKLENKNFVVAREAKHERELNNNSRDLKELRDKFRELENFFEEERERRTREEEQKNFQEEKSQERRDLMEELVQILQKKYEKNN